MPTDLRSGYRHACVGRRRAGEHDLATERRRLLRRRQLHEKLWPLVFLDADADAAGESIRAGGLGEDRPLPWQGPGRYRKVPVERAVGGRCMPGLRHLAAVGIAEHDVDLPLVNGAVLGRCDVARAGDSLIEDDLSRSVDAAVGDEHDRGLRIGLHVPPEARCIGGGLVPLAVDGRRGQHDIFPALIEPHFIAAVLVARGGAGLDELLRVVALLFADEQFDGRAGHRLARLHVNDMAGDFSCPLVSRRVLRKCLPLLFRHDRQPRHPDQRHLHDIVGPAKVGLVAGDHPVGPSLE